MSESGKSRGLVPKLALAALALLGAIQLVPVPRSNPAVEEEAPAPPAVRELLRRACYDCHSHETVWPWYGRVAPVSWLVAFDVAQGRRELNFSTWNRYSPERQGKIIRECREEVDEGGMPPWFYRILHAEARLTDEDKAALSGWAGR